MDADRFDDFSRARTASRVPALPRRAIARALTGLGLAGLLSPLDAAVTTEAKTRRKGKGKGKEI